MNQENQIVTKITQAKSIRLQPTNHSLSNNQTLISVKDAASQLGVSPSTVYRIDRQNGPFRFVHDDWRIYIDAKSFVAHLAGIVGADGKIDRGGVESTLQPRPEALQATPPTSDIIAEGEVPTAKATSIPLPATMSSGQQEDRRRPHAMSGFFQYFSFI
jgi:hypothetical protein